MNLVEAIELDRLVSALNFKKAATCQVFDAEKEGYCIVIKKEYVDYSCLNRLEKIAKEQGLKLSSSDKYYIISSQFSWINL